MARRFTGRWLKGAARWLVPRILWLLVAPSVGSVLGAALTAILNFDEPWATFFFAGVVGTVTAIVLGGVRPLVRAHFRDPEVEAAKREAQERRDREADDERRLRAGLLLVRGELDQIRMMLSDARQRGAYWDPPQRSLTFRRWEDERRKIAGDRRCVGACRVIATAYNEAQRIQHVVEDRARRGLATVVAPRDQLDRALSAVFTALAEADEIAETLAGAAVVTTRWSVAPQPLTPSRN